jgi:hypothetical protein
MSISALLTQFPPGATGYVAASDADQASLIRQSIQSFVTNTPALQGLVNVDSRKITVNSGAELIILAADSAGAHGLRPYWLVIDELANWPDVPRHREFFDALWAGLPKVSGSRGVVITTAGAPSHFARRIFEAAKTDPQWRVSDTLGPPPWTDPEEIESERKRLFPSTFGRLWLNEWLEAEDSIASPADVAAACHLDGPIAPEMGNLYVCTLDLGVKNDRTAAVIAHAERGDEGTRIVVDRLQVWVPRPLRPVKLEDVKAWLVEMCRNYRAKLVYDPSQAYLLVEQLRKSGVVVEQFTFTSSSVGRLAASIMQALRSRLLSLPNDEELRKELLSVHLRETSTNVLRVDTRGSGHDDRVVAIAMAVHVLTQSSSSDAREWFESLAPICRNCGSPNPKGSTACSSCDAPIAAPVEEPPQVANPFGIATWTGTDRPPDRNTVATLELLRRYEEQTRNGTWGDPNPYGRFPWTRRF